MAWYAMWQRCTNANNKQFRDYGQRGISVDARWRVFANFIEDMGERPEGSTIERVDNEKGYGPDNCKWATRKEQQRNRRVNHILEFNGQRRCLTEWAELLGLRPETIHSRIRAGWDLTRILSTPTMGKREVGLARWGKLTVA